MSSLILPPRLSTRLLLSLYGEQRIYNIQTIQNQRNKLLTEIDNSDITKPLTIDFFLNSTMKPEITQKVRRLYMNFMKEVSVIGAGNNQANAAKTLYNILIKGLKISNQTTAYTEICSYFCYISQDQFNLIWNICEELKIYADQKEELSVVSTEYGKDILFNPSILDYSTEFEEYNSILNNIQQNNNITTATATSSSSSGSSSSNKNTNTNITATSTNPNNNTQLQEEQRQTKQWLLQLCDGFLQTNTDSIFTTTQLYDTIVELCQKSTTSSSSSSVLEEDDSALQMELFNLIGEQGFDFMLEVMSHKKDIHNINCSSGSSSNNSSGSSSNNTNPTSTTAVNTTTNHHNTTSSNTNNTTYNDISHEDLQLIQQLTEDDYYYDINDNMIDDSNLSANQKRKKEIKEKKELEKMMNEKKEFNNSTGIYNTTTSGSNGNNTVDWLEQLGFNDEYLLEERALGLQKGRSLEVFTWVLV